MNMLLLEEFHYEPRVAPHTLAVSVALAKLHGRPDCRSRAARENRVIKQGVIECVLLRYVRRDYVSMTIFTAER